MTRRVSIPAAQGNPSCAWLIGVCAADRKLFFSKQLFGGAILPCGIEPRLPIRTVASFMWWTFALHGHGDLTIMRSSLAREIAALEAMEAVIARLTVDHERDEVISRLLSAIAQDRERLLAELVRVQQTGGEPLRFVGTSPTSIGAATPRRAERRQELSSHREPASESPRGRRREAEDTQETAAASKRR